MSRLGDGLEGRRGWLLVATLAAYIAYATIDWEVPAPGGIRFGPLWAACTLLATAIVARRRRQLRPTMVLAVSAVAGMILSDVTLFWSQGLRDFHLYLKAGEHYLSGAPVYLTGLVTDRPADLTNYPFLYPPIALPFFAIVAVLPRIVADLGWMAVSMALAVGGLRAIGMPWGWAIAALAWPPFAQGLYVGNVSIPAFALFAFAPWLGSGLVLGAVFKVYSGVGALWLLRDRHWAALGLGVAALVVATVVTLPMTGITLWFDWLRGLDWYAQSQPLLPASLYGIGLPRFVPEWAGLGLGLAATVVALRAAGRECLARLGVAIVVASPSLFAHGFPVAVPALLRLRPALLWFVIGLTSVAPGLAWWAAVLIIVVSWGVPSLRLDGALGETTMAAAAALHPLGTEPALWPQAPVDPIDDRFVRHRLVRAGPDPSL